VDIDSELGYLGHALSGPDPLGGYEAMAESSRLLVLRARSVGNVRQSQGGEAALAAAAEVANVAQRARSATQQVIAAQARRLNERMVDRLGVVDRIRAAVLWTFGGTLLVLLALFTAYRRARMREADALRQIEWLAHWDPITGLPNRSLLDDRLTQEIARAKRAAGHFTIVMFDLDGFKHVNDTLGHAAGDRLLGLVGDRSRACIRASDTVGRLSGDEFLAILPEANLEGAREVAEKLRLAVAEPYPFDRNPVRVTTSLGIACFPLHGEDAAALKAAADAALYAAKRAGKNRVEVASLAAEAVTSPGGVTA
jgi:diguanylate cyclase (GGDEF)-like protein